MTWLEVGMNQLDIKRRECERGMALMEVLMGFLVLLVILWGFSKVLGSYSVTVEMLRAHSQDVSKVLNGI